MESFKEIFGDGRFHKNYYKNHEKELLDLVENGQHPKALYIGCSDSRVLPNLMTKSAPGDLFVIRNVGNLIAPYSPDEDFHSTASGIEYAVTVLKVKHIVVCGHTHCGAIEAIYHDDELKNPALIHTRKWLTLAHDAKNEAIHTLGSDAKKEELLRLTEQLSVLHQIENLLTYPSVQKAVKDEEIDIHGWIYDIASGKIEYYDTELAKYLPMQSLQ